MDKNEYFDSLHALHLGGSEVKIYGLIEQIVILLDNMAPGSEWQTYEQISAVLGEAQSTRILELICQKLNVDYATLLHNCQSIADKAEPSTTHIKVTARLLLHMLLVSISFVCNKLQVDENCVEQMLVQLRHNFTIDSPLSWLRAFLKLTEHERKHQIEIQEKLLHSGYAVGQAPDTAEERKVKERKDPSFLLRKLLRKMF